MQQSFLPTELWSAHVSKDAVSRVSYLLVVDNAGDNYKKLFSRSMIFKLSIVYPASYQWCQSNA